MLRKTDSSQEEFRKKVEERKAALEESERRALESAYVERPSCWRFIGVVGWIAGIGGLLSVCGGILGLFGVTEIASDWSVVMLVTGLASLIGGVFDIYLRPQWTRTLMELRALQERAGARIASTSMDRLAQNEAESERRIKELNDDLVKRLETSIAASTQDTSKTLRGFELRLDKIVRDWEGGDEYSREAYNFIGTLNGTLEKMNRNIDALGARLAKLESVTPAPSGIDGGKKEQDGREVKAGLRGYQLAQQLKTTLSKPRPVKAPLPAKDEDDEGGAEPEEDVIPSPGAEDEVVAGDDVSDGDPDYEDSTDPDDRFGDYD